MRQDVKEFVTNVNLLKKLKFVPNLNLLKGLKSLSLILTY